MSTLSQVLAENSKSSHSARPGRLTMSEKKTKTRTPEQRAARAKARSRLLKEARAKGLAILEAAKKGGYKTAGKPRKFVGSGKYRGRGGYIDDGIDILGAGIKKGAGWLTDKAASLLKSLIGSGDYIAGEAPTENGHVMGAMPTMVGTGNEPCLVIEDVKEVGKLTATDVFKRTSYDIQPGLGGNDALFHWLPSIARKFESYTIEAGVFLYKPLVSPLQDAASGDLAMVVVYDVNDEPPQNMSQCLNTYMAVGGRPMDAMMMALECAPSQTQTRIKYIRGSEPEASLDADHNLYDWGVLHVCQEGQPTSTVGQTVGRLYITYKIKFYKPLDEFDEQDPVTAHYTTNTTFTTAASPFGATASEFKQSSPAGFDLTWVNAGTCALPSYVKEGKWLAIYRLVSTAGGAVATTMTMNIGGGTALSFFKTTGGVQTSVPTSPLNAELAQSGTVMRIFNVSSAAPTISMVVTYGANYYWDLFVIPVDVDLVALAANKKAWRRARRMGRNDPNLRLSLMESRLAALTGTEVETKDQDAEYHQEMVSPRGPTATTEGGEADCSDGNCGPSCARIPNLARAERERLARLNGAGDDQSDEFVLASPAQVSEAKRLAPLGRK